MTNQLINVLVASILGAVAFIVVRAVVFAEGAKACTQQIAVTNTTNITMNVTGRCGEPIVCPHPGTAPDGAITNCSFESTIYEMNATITPSTECWSGAECAMVTVVLPLAIAIFTIVLVLFGLARVKGPG